MSKLCYVHWVFPNSHLDCAMLKGRLETFWVKENVFAYIRHGFNLLHVAGWSRLKCFCQLLFSGRLLACFFAELFFFFSMHAAGKLFDFLQIAQEKGPVYGTELITLQMLLTATMPAGRNKCTSLAFSLISLIEDFNQKRNRVNGIFW